jgi:triacylglycerol esterase/lipase EstA (alpha/beta hydrolase family)
MFKIGERVVFVDDCSQKHEYANVPQNHEVVTVHGYCDVHKGNLDIAGYLYARNGKRQSIPQYLLRKLDTDWAEKVLAEALENELVLIEG